MKITKMRINGKVPSTDQVLAIRNQLRKAFEKAGFITNVEAMTRSSLKIGLHMRSFKIDVNMHGYNVRFNPHIKERRTSTPNWDQRVEFNNIVNHILNLFEVSATVKSGPFTIRKELKNFFESDWNDQKPEFMHHNEMRGYSVEAA